MQEEALKLILKVLEGGAFLSRKNIVLYVDIIIILLYRGGPL